MEMQDYALEADQSNPELVVADSAVEAQELTDFQQ